MQYTHFYIELSLSSKGQNKSKLQKPIKGLMALLIKYPNK